jgi:hypothetical protein
MTTARLAGLALLVIFGFGSIFGCYAASRGPAPGPVIVKVTSCSFNAPDDSVNAHVVLSNGTSRDADLASQVYWLTSVAPAGTFGNGNDGTLDPGVIGNDYVGGSEPAEADVLTGQSLTVPVNISLGGGVPEPPGLRCVASAVTNNGAPWDGG